MKRKFLVNIKKAPDFPHFVIIGAAKSGTTSLFAYLKQHPKIFMSDPKEPCFFDENENWDKGKEWYFSLFEGAKEDQLCGEASTNYTRWPQVKNVPSKLYEFCPNVKLIYLMREPSERAYAHYVHRWLKELHPGEPFKVSFDDFVKQDPMCIDSGFYAKQLDQYLEFFSTKNIYPIIFEELIKEPKSVMQGVFNFLGLEMPAGFNLNLPVENESKSYRFNKSKAAYRDKLKSYKVFRLFSKFLPTSLKDAFYLKFLSKTKTASKIKSQFEPIPLTLEQKRALKAIYIKPNQELARKYNVDISFWR